MKTDFTWGSALHMPEEVTGAQGRATVTSSSSSHPSATGECLIAGPDVFSGTTAAVVREAEVRPRADAGESRTGAVVPVTAPVPQLLIADGIRGAWWS